MFFCSQGCKNEDQGCRNKELDDKRKVKVIGCHGSIDKHPFDIGSNLTKVHAEDKKSIILRIPESMCAGLCGAASP